MSIFVHFKIKKKSNKQHMHTLHSRNLVILQKEIIGKLTEKSINASMSIFILERSAAPFTASMSSHSIFTNFSAKFQDRTL